MLGGTTPFSEPVPELETELDEMSGWVVRRVASIIVGIALLLLARASFGPEEESWEAFSGGLALGSLGLLTYRLSRWGIGQSSACLVVGLLAIVTAATLAYGDPGLPVLFAPIVVVAGIARGWRQALAAAVAGSAVTLATTPQAEPLLPGPALLSLSVIWLSAILTWITQIPLRTALSWAWTNYADARRKTEELRKRQQELTQALRSLDSAYSRLSAANAELARARHAAEEARLAKVEFATTLSHELRTPLNLVIGFSEMMAQAPHSYYGESLPSAYADDVKAIYRNASHVASLVDDVLDLARVEAHRMPLRRQRVSVVQVVDEATTAVWGLLRYKDLSLVVEIPPDLPPVWADPSRVRQILINLLNNACRSTDDGGICVHAELVGGDVVLSVADTGVGIAPEELSRAFDEFRQTGDLLRQRSGSGLGLAICKAFVEMQGGSIWAESQVGIGSTFYFSLPTCDCVVSVVPERNLDRLVSSGSHSDTGRTLTVLDSDPEALVTLQRYLHGYRLVGAGLEPSDGDTEETATPVAAVLTGEPESYHPGDLARGLPGDQFVVLCPLTTGAQSARRFGATDYLAKPVTGARLEAVLRQYASGTRPVLVVDDDPEVVHLITRMILGVQPNRRVLGAISGAEALAMMSEERPDMVLLDLLMPGLSGYDVLSTIRLDAALCDVPVVIMSAKGQMEEAIKASMVGVTRPGGLTVGEAIASMEAILGALLGAAGNASPEVRSPKAPPEGTLKMASTSSSAS